MRRRVVEPGAGLGFVTIIITYMPVLYQLFAKREAHVVLLDQRAGTPVTAMGLICNHARRDALDRLTSLLAEWESWAAELLESHLSFPVLSYYRSQHDNQSWLSSLTAVLDACAIYISLFKDRNLFQAVARSSRGYIEAAFFNGWSKIGVFRSRHVEATELEKSMM